MHASVLGTRIEATPRRRPLVADVLLALALLVVIGSLSLSAMDGLRMPPLHRAVLVVALLVLHACVVTRRTRPAASYALACAAMLTVLALPDARPGTVAASPGVDRIPLLVMPSCLLYAVMLASVSARRSARDGTPRSSSAGTRSRRR